MLGSLRFRLPALFLLGIVLAGARRGADLDPLLPELQRARVPSTSCARSRSASCSSTRGRRAARRAAAAASMRALGGDTHLLGAGVPGVDAAVSGLPHLPTAASIDAGALGGSAPTTMELTARRDASTSPSRGRCKLGDKLLRRARRREADSRSCAAAR